MLYRYPAIRVPFLKVPIASAKSIDPLRKGKHIGTSQLMEEDPQYLCEKTVVACSGDRFNNYDYRCNMR